MNQKNRAANPATAPLLHWFAVLAALTTLVLLAVGGLVTSHGAGMAVPDWPNTYGYNMFAFPFSKWVGGILYEHSHRLIASFVGLLTSVLAIWLWVRETSGKARALGVSGILFVFALMGARILPVYLTLAGAAPIAMAFALVQTGKNPGSLRWLGILAFAAVILQGVLGGLRVVWMQDQIGIVHATLAQLFFSLLCAVALLTSRWWRKLSSLEGKSIEPDSFKFNWLLPSVTLLLLLQLILGAIMRHQHAGLAIPDFPLAYGKIWPPMDQVSVAHFNQQRHELTSLNAITGLQIGLQMAHRILALLICAAISFCAWSTRRHLGARHPVTRLARFWLGIILVQALLGASTIWSNKAADIATAHVLAGAFALATGVIAMMVWFRVARFDHALAAQPVSTRFSAHPSTA